MRRARRELGRFYVARWTAAGGALGLGLVFIAWQIAIATSGAVTFIEIHADEPIIWVVDSLPAVLGLAAGAIGLLHLRLTQQRAAVEATANQIAARWTADLRAANEDLVEAMEARHRYYSALSHELRTPLSSIVGYSELVEEADIQPPELSAYMAEIYGSARALLAMVNDLLDAAKLEVNGVSVQLTSVDTSEVVTEAAQCLLPLARRKGLTIETDIRAVEPARADPTRLRQVLTNLLSNAIKYSDRGPITVRSTAVDGEHVQIEVEDNGIGISPPDLERIFRPFEQTAAGSGRSDSTGLGLTISKAFVEAMGGTIGAVSDGEGSGTTFHVRLPIATGFIDEQRTAKLTALA